MQMVLGVLLSSRNVGLGESWQEVERELYEVSLDQGELN